AVSLRNPLLAASVGGITALATLTASYTLMKIRESGQLAPSASGMLGGLMSLLTPTNVTAAAYSIATVALAVVGVMMFTADPSTPSMLFIMPKDPVQVFCSRIIGGATLANSVLLFTVKQAADDGRQGSPTFRNINAGIASYAAITAGVLGYGLAVRDREMGPPMCGLRAPDKGPFSSACYGALASLKEKETSFPSVLCRTVKQGIFSAS
ncbi:hypothetical protein Vretifemale_16956, partial [Volvox reticuliferus]